MEISGNSLNQPVNFYTKNTENTINMAIDGDNQVYSNNIFAPQFVTENIKQTTIKQKKKRKNNRLNTLDSEYLPDEAVETSSIQNDKNNFFIENKQENFIWNIRKLLVNIINSTPLINYFFLRKKKQNIEKTVEKLSDINQNVDELLNSAIPYGESGTVYSDITNNLTTAATLISQANKDK